jgi:hypothetical protein
VNCDGENEFCSKYLLKIFIRRHSLVFGWFLNSKRMLCSPLLDRVPLSVAKISSFDVLITVPVSHSIYIRLSLYIVLRIKLIYSDCN